MRRYATEADAPCWFEEAPWSNGPVCPRCGVECRSSRILTRARPLACLNCQHRYSVTSGTALHDTKLPLRTWLIAMYLITASSKGISALKLSEWLGVSYTRGRSALALLVHVSEGPLTYRTLTA